MVFRKLTDKRQAEPFSKALLVLWYAGGVPEYPTTQATCRVRHFPVFPDPVPSYPRVFRLLVLMIWERRATQCTKVNGFCARGVGCP